MPRQAPAPAASKASTLVLVTWAATTCRGVSPIARSTPTSRSSLCPTVNRLVSPASASTRKSPASSTLITFRPPAGFTASVTSSRPPERRSRCLAASAGVTPGRSTAL
jgi:hypothetical protein